MSIVLNLKIQIYLHSEIIFIIKININHRISDKGFYYSFFNLILIFYQLLNIKFYFYNIPMFILINP